MRETQWIAKDVGQLIVAGQRAVLPLGVRLIVIVKVEISRLVLLARKFLGKIERRTSECQIAEDVVHRTKDRFRLQC